MGGPGRGEVLLKRTNFSVTVPDFAAPRRSGTRSSPSSASTDWPDSFVNVIGLKRSAGGAAHAELVTRTTLRTTTISTRIPLNMIPSEDTVATASAEGDSVRRTAVWIGGTRLLS